MLLATDFHAVFSLLLTVAALFLFTRERIPLETSCLVVLVVLVLVFELLPYERNGVFLHVGDFFSGFGHEALVTIAALMIVGRGLETTGALGPVAVFMSQGWKRSPVLSMLLMLIMAAFFSAFMNNTPIVVVMLPILISVAIRSRQPPSALLLPMGLATLIGGMATTIGTSTNLLVVGIAHDLGMPRMSMFHFTLPVLLAGSVGITFLWLVAPRLLPPRKAVTSYASPRVFNAVMHVTAESHAAGRTLADVRKRTDGRLAIAQIERGKGLAVARLPSLTLLPGDRLHVRDTPEHLKEFESLLKVRLDTPTVESTTGARAPDTEQQLAEVVVTRRSLLHGNTLAATHFSDRYGLLPLAIHRARQEIVDASGGIEHVRLRAGDVLLVQGAPEQINALKAGGQMLVLDGTTDLPYTRRAPLAIGILLFVVGSAAAGLLPISVSALTGVALMILTRCIDWRNAVGALNMPVVLIIVASLALGTAVLQTGAADLVAHAFVVATGELSVPARLAGLMLLMAVFTNIVSNNAAAVIGTPISIRVAEELGYAGPAAEPFVLAVLFGANMSFATPMGYKTNLLVFSAGGYRFNDFLRVGIPLILLMWAAFSFLMPILYDL